MRKKMVLGTTAGALLLLALPACGGSASSTSSTAAAVNSATPPAAGGSADGRTDFTAYRDCMAQNGVTMPEMGQPPAGGMRPSGAADLPSGMPTGAPPSGGPGGFDGPGSFPLPDGVDQATFDAAEAACASLRPTMGQGGGGPANLDQTAVAAFTSCLTDHDVTVPEGDAWMTELDRSDATVKAAMDTCAPLLPQPAASQ